MEQLDLELDDIYSLNSEIDRTTKKINELASLKRILQNKRMILCKHPREYIEYRPLNVNGRYHTNEAPFCGICNKSLTSMRGLR